MDIKQVVPGTPYTAEQLCRVESTPGIKVKTGTIMARRGAFQHKFVVESVTLLTPDDQFPSHDRYALRVRNLGVFYADNEFELATRSRSREMHVYCRPENKGSFMYSISGYVPVKPVGDVKVVQPKAGYLHNATKAGRREAREKAKKWQAEQAGKVYVPIPGSTKTVAVPAPPPRPPEAILADYLV